MTKPPEFPFARNDHSRKFCGRVCDALVRFAGKSQEEAAGLVLRFWQDLDDIEDDELIYHEAPYYYAMCIAHHPLLGEGRDYWWQDESLWPPPPGWECE